MLCVILTWRSSASDTPLLCLVWAYETKRLAAGLAPGSEVSPRHPWGLKMLGLLEAEGRTTVWIVIKLREEAKSYLIDIPDDRMPPPYATALIMLV